MHCPKREESETKMWDASKAMGAILPVKLNESLGHQQCLRLNRLRGLRSYSVEQPRRKTTAV